MKNKEITVQDELKILELKAKIFDIIRQQETIQNELNRLQTAKQQLAQALLALEKQAATVQKVKEIGVEELTPIEKPFNITELENEQRGIT